MSTSALDTRMQSGSGFSRLTGTVRQHWFGYLLVAPLLLWLRYVNLLSGFVLFALWLLGAPSRDRASAVSGSVSPA